MVVCVEGEALLVVGLVDQKGTALVRVLANFCPESFAYASRWGTHENAGGDLQEPAGEKATQSGGAVGEDDDGHQIDSSP
ncbi:hypothetical protein GCM10010232_67510 [Streptomyces amakusaensis]